MLLFKHQHSLLLTWKKSVQWKWDHSKNVQFLQKCKKIVAGVYFVLINLICSCLLSYTAFSVGSCSATSVRILGDNMELSAGEGFNLRCEFTCLGAQHVAQMWRNSRNQVVQKHFQHFSFIMTHMLFFCIEIEHTLDQSKFEVLSQVFCYSEG